MPISITSRYYSVPVEQRTDQNNRVTEQAIEIRPPVVVSPDNTFAHIVTRGETMEYLAWKYYGASEFWWRIADANPLFFPMDLPGGVSLVIPSPGGVGQALRTRNF